jgi:two-component system, LuxR family, response regulator FixJ
MSAGTGLIAVVDDDPAVCDSLRVLLETHGFEVRTYLRAANLLEDGDDIACLIVDYQMPELNGLDLVSELRRRGNGLPTILITTRNASLIEQRATKLGISHVLKKPLSPELLLNAVREQLP